MTIGKMILRGKICLVSPAIIGSGEGERSDTDLLLDHEGKPYIPATSLIGVLRHVIKSEEIKEEDLHLFWGYTDPVNNTGRQSAICCSDLSLNGDASIVIRDGIKIDQKKGIVADQKKFDYEIVEPGARFRLNIEVDAIDKNTKDFNKRVLATIFKLLSEKKLTIGAKTNSGFGRIALCGPEFYEFDFTKKRDILNWLSGKFENPHKSIDAEPFTLRSKDFVINASFQLKNSLIVRSYPSEPEMADAVHIQSNKEHILPGTSLKGAIRGRAERILKTLDKPPLIAENLFGDVDKEKKIAKKGKIRVEEAILPKFIAELHNRIKIDRFTGGTIDTALFDSVPLFSDFNKSDFNKKVFTIQMSVRDYQDYEAGLLLLVLKDFWTGDLAVGGEKNVGRGVLEGEQADIIFDNSKISLEKDFSKLSKDYKEKLEKFVKALVNFEEGENS